MLSAAMKKVLVIALAMVAVMSSARQSHALLVPIGLAVDLANSSASGFNGSMAKTINDTFAYNPETPTVPMPATSYGGGATDSPGFHAVGGNGADVFLSYNLAGGPLKHQAAQQAFFLDLYGRSNCCTNRDDNFDIQVFSGGVGGTLLGTVTGAAIGGTFHTRVNLAPVLPVGGFFDAIRLVAHDTDGTTNANSFTLMEIRAAQLAIPEPATASLALIGLAGMMARRRRIA